MTTGPHVAEHFIFEPGQIDPTTDEAMPEPDMAREWLGRKGLLGKDDATRLALCAVHGLLREYPDAVPPGPQTGVVVATVYNNIPIVRRDANTLRQHGDNGLSPLDAPTHSANIVGSTLAIRHGWQGPNVTVCSSANAGPQSLGVARSLVGARRCERVVLVGVESARPDWVPEGVATTWTRSALAVAAVVRPLQVVGADQVRPNGESLSGARWLTQLLTTTPTVMRRRVT